MVFEKDPATGKWKLDDNGRLIVRSDVSVERLERIRYNTSNLIERVFRDIGLLKQASAKWMKEAFFGSGKFHNDMHGGNMMVNVTTKKVDSITLIDFGNIMKLEKNDRKRICNMLVYTTARDVEGFCTSLFDMIKAHAKESGHALTKDEIEKIKAIASSILMKGKAGTDAGYRFLAILEELRKIGVTLPESIYGVTRGLSRLQSALDDAAIVTKEAHVLYSALFGDKPCTISATGGVFNTNHIHCGFLGDVAKVFIPTSTEKEMTEKFDKLIADNNDNVYLNKMANRILSLSKTKEGLTQLEKELDEFYKLAVCWWEAEEGAEEPVENETVESKPVDNEPEAERESEE